MGALADVEVDDLRLGDVEGKHEKRPRDRHGRVVRWGARQHDQPQPGGEGAQNCGKYPNPGRAGRRAGESISEGPRQSRRRAECARGHPATKMRLRTPAAWAGFIVGVRTQDTRSRPMAPAMARMAAGASTNGVAPSGPRRPTYYLL